MFALIREQQELDRRGWSAQAAGGAQAERADETLLLLMTLEVYLCFWVVKLRVRRKLQTAGREPSSGPTANRNVPLV
jgi:hypothetical protein